MDIIKMAREIGKAIQESDEYKKMDAAKLANDNDTELQKDIEQFNLIRLNLSNAMQEDKRDDEKIQKLDGELKACYTKIMGNQHMLDFNVAKQDIDKLMSGITTILTAAVNGEDPEKCDPYAEGCTGSCGSCGGCH